jgi:hypothetical protein
VQPRPTPFPTISLDGPDNWQWPSPPLAWRHLPPPALGTPQPCSAESLTGAIVRGEMHAFEPTAGRLVLSTTPGGPKGYLQFTRFCRLTLDEPLRPAPLRDGAPRERVPAAAQERAYALHAPDGAQRPPLTGRTAGHVESPAGLYLFTPVEEEAAVLRVFVPRAAYGRAEFGDSAEEVAARLWISSPAELLAAIERQHRQPVLPIGRSLLALGLLTAEQLERALARPSGNLPLGERLVKEGLITAADLRTALAHKMGYPLVDLARFHIDPAALALVPQRVAASQGMMPLMLDKGRLIVAIDTPSRVAELNSMQTYVGRPVVPVLASKTQILSALYRLSSDTWTQNVPQKLPFVATSS